MSGRGLVVLVGAVAALAIAEELFSAALGDMMPSDVASDYDPSTELDYSAPDGFNADARTGMNDDVDDGSEGFTGL